MVEQGAATAHPLRAYIAIARLDHWFKNIFMLPGLFVAALVSPPTVDAGFLLTLITGVLSTCLAASANYSINEYLDAEFDRKHPRKHSRPAAQGLISVPGLLVQYLLLVAAALFLGSLISTPFLAWTGFFLLMGFVYNVRPFRFKEKPFLDVLSESVNNPIRFMLGWHLIIPDTMAPSSVLIAYWMGGAYLMAIKRMAEYRSIGDPVVARAYRSSFAWYDDQKLLICSFFYAMTSAFFLAIFLIKYRVEYIVCFPLLAVLFAWYLHIGLKAESTTQTPEKLYREKAFVAYFVFVGLAFVAVTFIDLPFLGLLTEPLNYRR